MKTGGGSLAEDLGRIEFVLKILKRGDPLAGDADRRFDRPGAIAYAHALERSQLRWYEWRATR